MKNHYHFLLQTGTIPLSKIMHRLNFLYGRYYNQRHARNGHVFGGRYKAALILDKSYLFAVLRYMHQNPVQAGTCSKASDYPWSSDAAYRNNKSSLVDIDLILNILSPKREKALQDYQELMSAADDTDFGKMKTIGDEDFLEKIKDDGNAKGAAEPGQGRRNLEEVLLSCGADESTIELIRQGSRIRNIQKFKRTYALSAWAEGYSYKQIGSHIGISDAAISRLLNQ